MFAFDSQKNWLCGDGRKWWWRWWWRWWLRVEVSEVRKSKAVGTAEIGSQKTKAPASLIGCS